MDKKNKIASGQRWEHLQKQINALSDNMLSLGIGSHLVERSGLPKEDIALFIGRYASSNMKDGEMHICTIENVRCYVLRRGKGIDAGTKEDFAELDLEMLSDLAEKAAKSHEN